MDQTKLKVKIAKSFSLIFLVFLLLGCGKNNSTNYNANEENQASSPPSLLSIQIAPANSMIPLGLSTSFTVRGFYSDNITKEITMDVTWTSSDANVAFITTQADGVVTAKAHALGYTTITATLGNVNGSTTLTVTDASLLSITIWPTELPMAIGAIQNFYAYGKYSDNSTLDLTDLVSWSVSDSAIATLSQSQAGITSVKSVSVGQAIITASYKGNTIATDVYVLPIQAVVVGQQGLHLPRIGIDGLGRITAIWQDWIAKPSVFTSARFEKEQGWLVEYPMETFSQNQLPAGYDMAFNENGQGLLVWSAYQSSYYAEYSPVNGWQIPQVFNGDAFRAALHVAIDSLGNGLATFGSQGNVYTSQYNPATSWTLPKEQGALGTGAEAPIVSMNSNGDAVLVWEQWDLAGTGDWTIHVALFDHQSGWQPPSVIYTSDTYCSPSAAIDNQGRVVVVWTVVWSDAVNFQTLSSWYIPQQGWQPVQTLKLGIYPTVAKVAVDSLGNAIAIWPDAYDKRVYANYYKEGQGWTGAVILRDPTPGYSDTSDHQIKMDAQGNAIALWEVDSIIEIKRFSRLSGWQQKEYLGGLKSFGVFSVNLAMNSAGDAVIVWIEGYESGEDLYVVTFPIF